MASKNRTDLSIAKKLEILDALKSKKATEVASEFKIGYSTVKKIRQKEEEIQKEAEANGNLKRKRKRESPNEEIGNALFVWFQQMMAQGAVMNGPMLVEKANQLATTLEYENFEPSNGWLERWKNRHNIRFFKLHGEKAAADHESAENWINNTFSGLIENYHPDDIFNADETGLFWKALPSGTLAVAGSQPTGGKTPKDRMTVLFLCNATGTLKKIYTIGNFKKPRCFNRAQPPLPYYSSANAWMTSWIWSDILKKFDRELGDRKIILFADNAACHKLLDNIELKNIKIIFMPPNTTSLIQPLDQGIIRATKAHYRTQIMRKLINAIDNGSSLANYAKSIDLLKSLHMLKRAWFLVSPSTIENCFRKAGFLNCIENQESTEPDPLENFGDFIEEEDFGAFIDCDNDVECFGNLTDNEICDIVKRNQVEMRDLDESGDDIETADETEQCVTHKDVLKHLSVVRKYLEQNFADYDGFYQIEDMIEKNILNNRTVQKKSQIFLIMILFSYM